MTVDSKLGEASESVRQARRQAQFTSHPPNRRHQTKRKMVLAAATAFVVVAVLAIPGLVLSGINEPSVSDVAAAGPGPSSTNAIGGDGPFFAVDDPHWTLDYAWQIAPGDGSSFVLYTNGSRQITTMTGQVADEAVTQMRELNAESVASDIASVDVYEWNEGVSYVWQTNDGTDVVVTFGQMSLDEAQSLAAEVTSVDEETFVDMVDTNPATPTTVATADSDS